MSINGLDAEGEIVFCVGPGHGNIHSIAGPNKGQGDLVDKQLKSLMKDLGDAINHSLSDSDQIAEVISRIKAGGYDVFVVLEATIGFNQQDEDDSENENAPVNTQASTANVEMTPQDVKFLKALRITINEEN